MGLSYAAAVTITVLFFALHLSPAFAQQAPMKFPQKAEPAKTTAPQPASKAQSSSAKPLHIDPSAVSLVGTVDLKTDNPIKYRPASAQPFWTTDTSCEPGRASIRATG